MQLVSDEAPSWFAFAHKHAPVEEEDGRCKESEGWLFQGPNECHDAQGTSRRLQARLDRQIGEDEECQDEKRAYAHSPSETNFGNQVNDHYGEDDTAQR